MWRIQHKAVEITRPPLQLAFLLVQFVYSITVRPVVRKVNAARNYVWSQLWSPLWAQFSGVVRALWWAIVLPIVALSLLGLLTGFVFGLVLARVSVILEVFPSASEKDRAVLTGSPIAKSLKGSLSRPAQSPTKTPTKSPTKSPAKLAEPPAGSPAGLPATLPATLLVQSPTKAPTKSPATKLASSPMKSPKPEAILREISTPPESIWETEDDLSHDDELGDLNDLDNGFGDELDGNDPGEDDVGDETVVQHSPSQLEFYSQFRLPEMRRQSSRASDDTLGDGYKTPPRRVRTPPSVLYGVALPLGQIQEDQEV